MTGGGRAAGVPVVAIVGRPNVGKSTLVNRFSGRRDAIVEERPGVTRDRTTHTAEWRARRFTLVDTGGWLPDWAEGRGHLAEEVSAQAERATATADLILFVVDATVGITEEDAAVAAWLRERGLAVLLIANKSDRLSDPNHPQAEVAELYRLGLGEPHAVSALHGRGSGDVLDLVVDRMLEMDAFARAAEAVDDIPGIALIGRPNVGKSSLFNRLVGEDRVVVDAAPGTTRDAVDTVVRTADGRAYRFVDTAGLRRKARLRSAEATEYYSSVRAVQALDAASAALLIVDAGEGVGEQEQKLARQILDAGRALVLVLNKWDLVDAEQQDHLDRELDRLLNFVAYAPIVRTSATTGRAVQRLLPAIDGVLGEWTRRVPTSRLNDWLADAVAATPPPMHAGRAVRIRYGTQVSVGPPRFRFFSTGDLEPTYLRYLERRLRESFGFAGTPLDVGVKVRPRWEERSAR
ncbi:ribosome biogenesis GTPase Der [soil metagenome]